MRCDVWSLSPGAENSAVARCTARGSNVHSWCINNQAACCDVRPCSVASGKTDVERLRCLVAVDSNIELQHLRWFAAGNAATQVAWFADDLAKKARRGVQCAARPCARPWPSLRSDLAQLLCRRLEVFVCLHLDQVLCTRSSDRSAGPALPDPPSDAARAGLRAGRASLAATLTGVVKSGVTGCCSG